MEKKKYRKQEASSFTKGRHRVQRRLTLYVIVSILFFNFLAIISLIAGSIGLLLALSLAPLIDFVTPFNFGDDVIQARGTLTEKSGTNVSIDENVVSAYHFSYSYLGKTYNGVSYTTGNLYKVNDSVPVEIEADDPAIARIEGMDVKPVHFVFSIFVIMFPLPGLVFLAYTFYKRVPYIHAIRYGIMTRGKFVRMMETGTVINKKTMYDVYFQFNDESGKKYTAIGTTLNTDLVQDEPEERIIYDPDNPSNAVVVDALPAAVRKFLASVPG